MSVSPANRGDFRGAGGIDSELHDQAVGRLAIHRFAISVIGHAQRETGLPDAANELVERGLIDLEGNMIEILDLRGLRRLSRAINLLIREGEERERAAIREFIKGVAECDFPPNPTVEMFFAPGRGQGNAQGECPGGMPRGNAQYVFEEMPILFLIAYDLGAMVQAFRRVRQ